MTQNNNINRKKAHTDCRAESKHRQEKRGERRYTLTNQQTQCVCVDVESVRSIGEANRVRFSIDAAALRSYSIVLRHTPLCIEQQQQNRHVNAIRESFE